MRPDVVHALADAPEDGSVKGVPPLGMDAVATAAAELLHVAAQGAALILNVLEIDLDVGDHEMLGTDPVIVELGGPLEILPRLGEAPARTGVMISS